MKKAIERVLNEIISNLDGMNIDPRDILLHHLLNTSQAEGITTAVPHAVPHHQGDGPRSLRGGKTREKKSKQHRSFQQLE